VDVPVDLIERMKRKEPKAFEEFLARFGRKILSFGFRMCGDGEDAREVLQDTLMKTFESVGELKQSGAFAGWLYRIAHNACLMQRRRSRFVSEEIPLEEVLPDSVPASADLGWARLPDKVLLDSELREKLQAAVLRLPEGYRSVLVMRDMEGLDTDETALALGLSKDVVKMRLHRGRAKVRNEIGEYLRSHPASEG
jgi:RNA polymerase sigma-70 factor, ECF subfamily